MQVLANAVLFECADFRPDPSLNAARVLRLGRGFGHLLVTRWPSLRSVAGLSELRIWWPTTGEVRHYELPDIGLVSRYAADDYLRYGVRFAVVADLFHVALRMQPLRLPGWPRVGAGETVGATDGSTKMTSVWKLPLRP